jgi:tetratricopeptide (TPR) repeat protein
MPKHLPKHRHLSKRLLQAARRGQITWRHLAEVLLARLAELCPGCREQAEAATAEEIPQAAYRQPVSRAVQIEDRLWRFAEDQAAVPSLLSLLRELPQEQRVAWIRDAPEHFANLALGESLLDEARGCLPDDPEGSLEWARTAEALAMAYTTPHYPHLILAIAYQGNAHRAIGDFDRARRLLHEARSLMETHQVTDLDLGAELHSLFGSLCSDLDLFDEAAEHLESAVGLYRALGEDQRAARALMQLGLLHGIVGEFAQAIETDHAALELLVSKDETGIRVPEQNRRLYLGARLNLALHLAEAGEPTKALDFLEYDEDFYEEIEDSHLDVRVAWLRARIALELGDQGTAEQGYLAVREEFVRQCHGFNAALLSLELAALYHGQRRFGELEETAVQAVELFQAYELHQEALAALVLLRDAARARSLTTETIARVTAFLREAERRPAARFHSPN